MKFKETKKHRATKGDEYEFNYSFNKKSAPFRLGSNGRFKPIKDFSIEDGLIHFIRYLIENKLVSKKSLLDILHKNTFE